MHEAMVSFDASLNDGHRQRSRRRCYFKVDRQQGDAARRVGQRRGQEHRDLREIADIRQGKSKGL